MEYSVRLVRDSLETSWGFRLQGGADLKSQLTIQRVFSGSPAEGELQRADIIIAIDNRDTSNLSHKAAEQLIKSAGGELTLRIKRTGPNQSLPHTQFTSSENEKNMWGQQGTPAYQPVGGPGYYNPVPQGSMYHDEPNNQQHYGWVPVHATNNYYGNQVPKKFYQPQNFNRPTPGPLAYKPAKNPYSATAHAAHLQYNSPLSLYSAKNAQNALNASVPGDSSAGQTIKLSAYHGGEAKGDVVDSPTLRYVLREDEVKAKTGHNPGMKFYKDVHEYGPGKVPLKAYKEEVDDALPTSDF